MRFVLEVIAGRESLAELGRRFGISRQTGYKWWVRYERDGPRGLEDRSSRPRHSPHATCEWMQDLAVSVRKSYPNWGPRKVRAHLQELYPAEEVPAASTIGGILKRRGLVRPRRRRRKNAALQRAVCRLPSSE